MTDESMLDTAPIPSGRGVDSVEWTPATRFAFRFVSLYLLLRILPFPFTYAGFANRWYLTAWFSTVHWIARHLFGHEIPLNVNGSGDNEWRWAMSLGILAVATGGAIVWSVADRHRPNYERLHAWFRVLLRLWLAESMVSYGAGKLFASQYVAPSVGQYLNTYGESSPMGLLWMMMQFSRPYAIFAGSTEVVGGILLIVPRLATLGACISAAALVNVFALNLSFDVSAKIRSFHMLLGAVVLLAPDARRLFQFFVSRRPVALREDVTPAGGWAARMLVGVQLVFGAYIVFAMVIDNSRSAAAVVTERAWPLAGVWTVGEFVLDGVALAPLISDPVRWQRLAVDTRQDAILQMMDGRTIACRTKFDETGRQIEIVAQDGPRFSLRPPLWIDHLTYTQAEPDTLVVEGLHGGTPMRVTLRRERKTYLLQTRGFHWINEFPFNR
jgi:uncharacterized membrane protein YphA (DoxX/SURF4 family)